MAGELAAALAAAQAEFPEIPKDKVNPHFKSKYASLDGVIQATRAALAKHGLAVTGKFTEGGLEAVLLHKNGEERSCGPVPLLVGKNDMQGLGSAITYARRYAIGVLLGVSPDEDDDGNAASGSKPAAKSRQQQRPEQQATASPPAAPATPPAAKDFRVAIRSTATPACLAELLKKWQAKVPVGSDPKKWQETMDVADQHQTKMVDSGKWKPDSITESKDAIMSIFNQLATAAQAQEL